jgi:hypothetical protein
VELNDWILALHLLSAFAMVGAIVLFWILIVAGWNMDTPDPVVRLSPVARVGVVAVTIGSVGTIVFGLWLAISREAYHPWDGWVIAALVLWAVAGGTGGRSGKEFSRAGERAGELQAGGHTGPNAELLALNRTRTGLLMHSITTLAVLLLLIDMIWKPGA